MSDKFLSLVFFIINLIQIIILLFAYIFFKLFFVIITKKRKNRLHRKYVIGTYEIAKNIYQFNKVLEDCYTVNSQKNPFYNLSYDFGPYTSLGYLFKGPVLLAYLAQISDVFIYIWKYGFLIDRKYDFIYLKLHKKKIITIFCGDDIRSIYKTKEYFDKFDRDGFWNYYQFIDKNCFFSPEHCRTRYRAWQKNHNILLVTLKEAQMS